MKKHTMKSMNGKLLMVLLLCFVLSNVSTQIILRYKINFHLRSHVVHTHLILLLVVQNRLQTKRSLNNSFFQLEKEQHDCILKNWDLKRWTLNICIHCFSRDDKKHLNIIGIFKAAPPPKYYKVFFLIFPSVGWSNGRHPPEKNIR